MKPEIISADEGRAFVVDIMANMNKCFAANDFSSNRAFMAEEMEWEWSGGVSGKGSKEDYFKVLEGSWGALVSQFLPGTPATVVRYPTLHP